MFEMKAVRTASFIEAAGLTGLIVLMMSVSIIRFGAAPHIPLLLVILVLIGYGLIKKVPYRTLESGLAQGAGAGMSAVYLFFFIGILISSWMMSGTIPTLMHVGFQFISPTFFFAIVFLITGIIGVSIGSSLTTVATIGVAFIGMASVLDISLAITAGAIVSGAFFGDKMSPLSDTTILASSLVDVDLFEHIKNMSWTTVPAFIISALIFGLLSPNASGMRMDEIKEFQEGLINTGLIHWYTFIPLLVLVVLTLKKVPALLTLAASSVVAVLLSFIHAQYGFADILKILFSGFVSQTGIEEIDELLTRGGLESMLFTVGLVLLALSMGGLLFTLGIVQSLLHKMDHLLKKASSVIIASAFTAISINILIGEQYLSILLTGQSFQPHFEKAGLANKNLSRVMEDAGTVVNPLVPWSVCGIFITNVLGVSTWAYLPFAFFCLLSPVLTVIFGLTGKTLSPHSNETD